MLDSPDMAVDQANGLRTMAQPGPVRVIAVTGAKGGVGKTNVSVNLAACFARLGRRVMLMDADLGLANVLVQHVGVDAEQPGQVRAVRVLVQRLELRHIVQGGIDIGDGASVSDFANVYSHSHDIVDGRIVSTPKTVLGKGVRITYHATILAGTTVADDSMVGAGSILTRSTEPHWVYVGVPARKVKEKDSAKRAAKAPPVPDPMADG